MLCFSRGREVSGLLLLRCRKGEREGVKEGHFREECAKEGGEVKGEGVRKDR